MAKKMKKTLALLMALVLCVSQMALPVYAETITETLADGTTVNTTVEITVNESTGEQTTTQTVESFKTSENSYSGMLGGESGTFTEYGHSGETTTTTTTVKGYLDDAIIAEESEGEFDNEHLNEDTAETSTTTESGPESTETEFAPEGEATGTEDEDFANEGDASVTTETTGTETTENAGITVDPQAEILLDAEGNPITDENGVVLTEEEAKLTFETETTTTTEEVEGEGEGSGEITFTGKEITENQEYIAIDAAGTLIVLDCGPEGSIGWLAWGTYDYDSITVAPETDDEGEATGNVTITVPLDNINDDNPGAHQGDKQAYSVTTLTPEDFAAMGITGKVVDITLNDAKSVNTQADKYDNVILDLSVTVENPDGTTTVIHIVKGKPVTDEYKVLITKEDVIPEEYLNDNYTITEQYDADGNHIGWTATPKEATQDGEASTEYSEVTEGAVTYTDEVTKIVSNDEMDAKAQTAGSGVAKLVDGNGDPYYEETTIQTTISDPVTGEAVSLTAEELEKYAMAGGSSISSTYTPPIYPYVPGDSTDANGWTEHYELETFYNDDGSVASYKLTRTVTDAEGIIHAMDSSESFGTTTTVETLTYADPLTKQETTVEKTTVKTVKTYVFTETTRVEQTELNRTATTTTDYVSSSESFLLAEGSSMYFEFEGTMYPVTDLDEEDDLKITAVTDASVSISDKVEDTYSYTDANGETKTAKQYNASVSFTVDLTTSAMNSDDLIAEVLDSNGNSLGKYRLTENPSWATNLVDLATGTKVATANGSTYTLDGLVLPNGVTFSVTLTDPTTGSYSANGGNAVDVAAANGADLEFDMVFSVTEPEFIHTTTTDRYSEVSEQKQTSTKEQTQKKTGMTVSSVTTEYGADRTSIVIRGNVGITKTETKVEKFSWAGMELGFEPDPTEPEETIPEETIPEETIPEETIPEETIPEETVPEETIPEETIPEETVPEETIPEETVPEETVPDEDDDEIIILDEDVPLAAVPHTGDLTGLWAAISFLSLGGTAILSRKRKED